MKEGGRMTLDGIPLALVNGVGTVGLLVVAYLMFATGRLFTKGQVDQMQRSHDAELARMEKSHEREVEDERHDKGEWRTEARLLQQSVMELNEQNRAMLTAFGPTLAQFLDGIRRAAKMPEVES